MCRGNVAREIIDDRGFWQFRPRKRRTGAQSTHLRRYSERRLVLKSLDLRREHRDHGNRRTGSCTQRAVDSYWF